MSISRDILAANYYTTLLGNSEENVKKMSDAATAELL